MLFLSCIYFIQKKKKKSIYTINESNISSKHPMSFISITTPFTNPQTYSFVCLYFIHQYHHRGFNYLICMECVQSTMFALIEKFCGLYTGSEFQTLF